MIKDLIKKISGTYPHNVEGKPLYHDIQRTLAACEFKLGNSNTALNCLNTTL